jgi:hypothetical protein
MESMYRTPHLKARDTQRLGVWSFTSIAALLALVSGGCTNKGRPVNDLPRYLEAHGLPAFVAADATFVGSQLNVTDGAKFAPQGPVDDTMMKGLRGKTLVFIRDDAKASRIQLLVPITFGKEEYSERSLPSLALMYAMIPPIVTHFDAGELTLVKVAQDGRILETSTRPIDLIGFRYVGEKRQEGKKEE